ncbi:MAG: cystathionine gamma-lyase, partial [Gaiellales bacterium]|nr:cystathionine gamma-lyase [Gaiellales bacterium]
MEFETRAIHAGQEPDPLTGSVNVPIYQTSTYAQDGVGAMRGGHDYARTINPTRTALEQCLASLEGAEYGLAFASGMSAIAAILELLSPGQLTMAVNDVYGGTYRLFSKVLAPKGYRFAFADLATPIGLSEIATQRPDMVWIETPTNPLLKVLDIRAIADATHAAGGLLVVDNTFASPYLQQPLELGADLVVHSTTKYIGGHSDVVGGFAGTSDPAMGERLRFLQNSLGAVPAPLDCFLIHRGLRTLHLRMEAHARSAAAVVELLRATPEVEDVRWPGFSGMVSFRHPRAT